MFNSVIISKHLLYITKCVSSAVSVDKRENNKRHCQKLVQQLQCAIPSDKIVFTRVYVLNSNQIKIYYSSLSLAYKLRIVICIFLRLKAGTLLGYRPQVSITK